MSGVHSRITFDGYVYTIIARQLMYQFTCVR